MFFHPVLILYTIKTANTFKKLLVGVGIIYVLCIFCGGHFSVEQYTEMMSHTYVQIN